MVPASGGRPGPVSASSRPVGAGWSANQDRSSSRRGSSSGGSAVSTAASVGCTDRRGGAVASGDAPGTGRRPPTGTDGGGGAGTTRGRAPGERGGRCEQVELRRRVGDRGRGGAGRAGARPRRPHPDVARVRPAGRQRRPVAARGRRGRAGQARPLPLQLLGVPGGHLRRLQGRPGPHQHQLPLRGRRARVPVGERRHGGRRLPRGVRGSHRGHPRPGARRAQLAVGRRRHGDLPAVGRPLRGGRRDVGHPRTGRQRAGAGPVGTGPRRPPHALHRRHHRDAQGRHVAPGRPVRPAQRQRLPALSAGRRDRRRPGRAGGQRTGHDPVARLPAHARDRWVHGDGVPERGRARGHPHRATVRPGRAARHRRGPRRSTA